MDWHDWCIFHSSSCSLFCWHDLCYWNAFIYEYSFIRIWHFYVSRHYYFSLFMWLLLWYLKKYKVLGTVLFTSLTFLSLVQKWVGLLKWEWSIKYMSFLTVKIRFSCIFGIGIWIISYSFYKWIFRLCLLYSIILIVVLWDHLYLFSFNLFETHDYDDSHTNNW